MVLFKRKKKDDEKDRYVCVCRARGISSRQTHLVNLSHSEATARVP